MHTAYPDVYTECAFDSDLNEETYAQTGWTDISKFVSHLSSGTLRGRTYELDQVQTGTLTVTLDNADGRFTPDSVESPYYPGVKSGKRLRIRGKNMQSLNVARTGAQDRSAFDFFPNPNNVVRYSASDAPIHIEAETYEASSGGTVIAATRDPKGGGTEITYISATSWLRYDVALEDRVADSLVMRVASQDGCTIQIRTTSPTGTVIASATVSAAHNWTTYSTLNFDISAAKLTGNNTLYVTFTSLGGTYACNINWLEFKTSGQHISMPTAVQHDPMQVGLTGNLADDREGWHIEATIDPLQPQGDSRVISWFEPIELGVRLTHSAYIWLVDGTEPASTWLGLNIAYYDANRNLISLAEGDLRQGGTPGQPTRYMFSDLPPSTAKYAIGHIAISTSNPYTTALTYAVAGIQTELPDNLAPSISGDTLCTGWAADNATFAYDAGANPGVIVTWGASGSQAWQEIHRLIPGEDYSIILEVTVSSGGPGVLVTIDDGFNTVAVPADGTPYDVSFTFTADTVTQRLKFMVDGTATAGQTFEVRCVNLVLGDEIPPLGNPGDTQVTEWERPKPIFDGWVEQWPITTTAQITEDVEITVDDRLGKLANAELGSVLIEEFRQDGAALIIPLTDSPNPSGTVAMLGTWADASGKSSFQLSPTRGDLGTATYTLGVSGPIGNDTALKLTPASPTQGYVVLPPFSIDYQYVAAAPASGPPGTLPTTELVVSKYYSTWHADYDSGNAYFSAPDAYQGDLGDGDMKSLYGFNYKAIQHDLAGAKIVMITFTLENYEWQDNLGHAKSGTLYLATHNYASRPSTWSSSRVNYHRYTVPDWAEHQYRTIRLLPNTVGKEFQNGTTLGFGIGPSLTGTHNGGRFATSQSGAKPLLTITYYPGG